MCKPFLHVIQLTAIKFQNLHYQNIADLFDNNNNKEKEHRSANGEATNDLDTT